MLQFWRNIRRKKRGFRQEYKKSSTLKHTYTGIFSLWHLKNTRHIPYIKQPHTGGKIQGTTRYHLKQNELWYKQYQGVTYGGIRLETTLNQDITK